MRAIYDCDNISIEVFIVCFYLSKDSYWKTSLFSDFNEASAYMLEVCKKGFSPELKHCYLEKLVFDSDAV